MIRLIILCFYFIFALNLYSDAGKMIITKDDLEMDAYYHIAQGYLLLGNIEDANSYIARIQLQWKKDSCYYYALEKYVDARQIDKAIEIIPYMSWNDSIYNNVKSYYEIIERNLKIKGIRKVVKYYIDSNQFSKAVQIAERFNDPGSISYINSEKASFSLEHDNFEEAIQYADEVIFEHDRDMLFGSICKKLIMENMLDKAKNTCLKIVDSTQRDHFLSKIYSNEIEPGNEVWLRKQLKLLSTDSAKNELKSNYALACVDVDLLNVAETIAAEIDNSKEKKPVYKKILYYLLNVEKLDEAVVLYKKHRYYLVNYGEDLIRSLCEADRFEDAFDIAETENNLHNRDDFYVTIAIQYLKLDKLDDAFYIADHLASWKSLPIYSRIVQFYCRKEQINKAIELMNRFDDNIYRDTCLIHIADYYIDIGNFNEARKYVDLISNKSQQYNVLKRIEYLQNSN